MANSYLYISHFLLLSLCVSGGIGSEFKYNCEHQSLSPKSTIPVTDREEGRVSACIQIGWIESQQQYGLKKAESSECLKALSFGCQMIYEYEWSKHDFEFIKAIGNNRMGFKVNCKIDIDDERKRPINVWQCGDDDIHTNYILQSAAVTLNMASKDRCSPERATSCVAPMKELMARSAVIATNKEKLLEVCRVMNPAMQCLNDVLEECMKSAGIKFQQLISGITSTLNKMCDVESQFSKDYLRHAPCMAKLDERIGTCARVKTQERKPSSDKDAVEILCCSVKSVVTCTRDLYTEHCGAEAAEMGYQIIKTMFGPMVQNTCMDSYGNFKCSGCNSLFSMSPVTTLLSLATLYFIFRRINHF